MKLKNNKGYVAVDASIAVLILLIIVPTIAGMIYNVNKTNNLIDRQTEALSMAVNTIEAAKGIGAADLTSQEVMTKISNLDSYSGLELLDITDTGETLDKKVLTLTKDENTYRIIIEVQDYADTEEAKSKKDAGKEIISDKVKIVKVTVTFKSGKQEKDIELSTVVN